MPEDISLRERILKARKDEFEKEYEENVAPMKNDINEFFSALKNYCLEKNYWRFGLFTKSRMNRFWDFLEGRFIEMKSFSLGTIKR